LTFSVKIYSLTALTLFLGTLDMLSRIKEVIELDVNPYLALHQGGAELVDFDDGVVTLKLFGGCSGCPSSQITLFNGITPILMEKIPEIKDVVLDN
jgi:Fe/S biogenesis protein NfuA